MKKILFLNTTKLAVLSAMLLLAVFCTIGMSFTPAEEGENVGNPNDSTYVTGPRRSHWTTTTTSCGNTTYHNDTDYARVNAVVKIYDGTNAEISSPNIGQVTLENISTSTETGTVEESLLLGNETTSAYINWNSSAGTNSDGKQVGNTIIAAAHKLKVKFTAECIHDDYNFVGWYKTEQIDDNNLKSGQSIFEELICIGGGTSPGAGYGNYADSKQPTYTTGDRYTVTYYACFRPKTKVTITLKATENGTYTYTDGTQSGTITSTDESIETKSVVTLQASPATGYKFFGWYEIKDGKETYFSYESSTEKTFPTDATIYAKFIPSNWATYIVRNKPEVQYYDFQAAANAADASTDKFFLPLINGVVPAGNYTIPSGVTLLVPYEATYKNATNEPEFTESGGNNPAPFRTLTLAEGVAISVNGSINVNARLRNQQNTNGAQNGVSGMINMQEGSTITLNSGANLYCWGIIYGKGEITANSGATVYESFQVNDYPGGTFLSLNLTNYNKYKVFPVRIYCFPNIQSKLHLHHGATEKVATVFATDGVGLQKDIAFISTDNGLFITKAGSVITKWYDKDNDLQMYQAKGSIDLESIELKIASSYTVNSANFILPITHNMHIELLPQTNNISSTVTLTNDIAIHPGAKILVNKNVTVQIAENKALYVYDLDQWENNYTFANGVNKSVVYPRSKTISYDKSKGALTDAILEVAGTVEINGALYTTSSGANIKGVDGGKVIWRNKAPENKNINQCIQSGKYSGEWPEILVTSAQLHNDETRHSAPYNYTQTSDAVADDEFWYVESLGKWVKNEFGPELDIVDADNTKKTLTINANGWASSGWPYTVDGVKYDKGDREDDRTLIIPYNGTAGASLPIAVLDKDGKPICRHIYKVPFVYTGTEDMSDMNENSIVFVKSGTLTVGTASAKEIYVADSAELKVTGTLTVGKLVLRTTPYKAAILTNNGTIDGQVYYSRISPNSEQYYQFGLPLSCALANVKMSNTDKLGGSQPKYGTAWMLKSYSESSRANNGIKDKGANWSLLPSNGTITAGVGYEMFSNSNYYREFYFPVDLTTATNKVSVQYTGGTISAEHNGWNIITSPLTSRANVPIIDPATAFKVCWLDEKNGSYRQKQDTVIPPAIPFSIQASAEGELNFAVPTIAAAPRKQSAAEALTETEWVHLDIFDAYGEGDETSLFVHPTRFEQTYKTGIDMAKQSLTASRPIIYSTHAYGDMAFAGVADSLLENGIDLVVYSPSAQELTFSLRENKFLNRLEYLWLADNETGARTDLLMNDYTFRADAGTIKGRFVLNGRFKASQISTGIGNTQTDYNIYAIGNNIAISGVEQGTPIYVFDAVGHMIYTTAATSDEVIVPAPCAGVYMLTIGGQTAKLVINQ